ncbi:MAG: ABC transporter ATP-binding protein [Lentisphaerae bacterium]|nr:ABC transporter ATP-binding protein [Lentisphaerota bacterium]
MLKIQHLSKVFAGPTGKVEALQDVSLTVRAAEFVAIQGVSGCGKTTLLLAAGGLLKPTSGQITVQGEDFYALSPERRAQFRARRIGFVFQQFHLMPFLNASDNIRLANLAVADHLTDERVPELIKQFGLAHRQEHLPEALSTGERQRIALARALLNKPALLLADEPTGNLDEQNGAAVLQALKDYAASGGAVLLVTHDIRVGQYAHRRLRLERGRLAD